MSQEDIKRSDSRDLDYYVKYLHEHGNTPSGAVSYRTSSAKNVAALDGGDFMQMPAFYTEGIRLNLADAPVESTSIRVASRKSKFARVENERTAIDRALAPYYNHLFHSDGKPRGEMKEVIEEEIPVNSKHEKNIYDPEFDYTDNDLYDHLADERVIDNNVAYAPKKGYHDEEFSFASPFDDIDAD